MPLEGSTVQEKQTEVSAGKDRTLRTAPKLNRSPLHGLWALTNRDLRKWYTNPIQLFVSLIQPIVWLGLFGKALNFGSFIAGSGASIAQQNAILKSFFGTTSYFSFLACGMLAFIVLFTSAFSGMSVVFDRRFGFLNKALSTPVARGSISDGQDPAKRWQVAGSSRHNPSYRGAAGDGHNSFHYPGNCGSIRRHFPHGHADYPRCSPCSH